MKSLKIALGVSFVLFCSSAASASQEALFPDVNQSGASKPSLNEAINSFENIMEDSVEGDKNNLDSSCRYNQQRIDELKIQIAEKKKYLQDLPDRVSREFDKLMQQYGDIDQEQKNKISQQLHDKWKQIENREKIELAHLEEQLAAATSRVSDSQLKQQMLHISTSISDKQLLQNSDDKTNPDVKEINPEYLTLSDLSRRRILNKVQSMISIQIKPMDDRFSLPKTTAK